MPRKLNYEADVRAPCRIRTNDPRITSALLWPTELRRQISFFYLFLTFTESRFPKANAKIGFLINIQKESYFFSRTIVL